MSEASRGSETAWAARISCGDGEAFEKFLDLFGPRVLRLARRYAPVESDAEDLTQEIFVSLFRSAGNFRGEASLSTWVYRVALNHCLRHIEKSGRAVPSHEPREEGESAEVSDKDADPARHASRRELGDHVRGALDELSDAHREVIILHEMHGLSYAQCAHVLQVPIGTVKSRLSNAFRRLRHTLGPYVLGDDASDQNASSSTLVGASTCEARTAPRAAYGETP